MRVTAILEPLDKAELIECQIKVYKEIWLRIYDKLVEIGEGEDCSFAEFLSSLNITEKEYILAIRSSLTTSTVLLKRTPREIRVNNYNKFCLRAWRANMDLQYVLDVYACATYIASYITKSQRGMSELLRKACDEVNAGNNSIKEQLRVVGNKFLNAVELSAQEAAYITLQLPMKKSSRKTVFVNTSPPDERVVLLKPSNTLEEMDDDDDDIECTNMIFRYSHRPRDLDQITLAEFAAYYDNSSVKPVVRTKALARKTQDGLLPEPVMSENEDDPDTISTKGNSKKNVYSRRKVPRILRYVHFNADTDTERYYRELLMLYTSWHSESELLGDSESYQSKYEESAANIALEKNKFEPFSEIVDSAENALAENPDLQDAWDQLAPDTQQREATDLCNQPTSISNTKDHYYDIGVDLGLQVTNSEQELTACYELPDIQYRSHMRLLNKEQMEFVYNTMHDLKTSQKPICRFLSGGAGVGKSFVTRALYQFAVKYFNKIAGEDFSSQQVMMVAPTGKAAYHIHGNTIHSAFKIAANQKTQHKPLKTSTLNTFRTDLGQVRLVIIDEISMVGFNLFNCIHQRLMELKQSKDNFGGLSIIAVGDLFQLKPVMDSYVFQTSKSAYMPLATNLWQEHFLMTELKQIMRQQDGQPFAHLLNRLREGNHTDNDICQLKEHIVPQYDREYPHNAPHLFTTNAQVDAHNALTISQCEKSVYRVRAKDRVIGSTSPSMKDKILKSFERNDKHTRQLPTVVELAVDILYDLTVNTNTQDGLINGASCRMMSIEINSTNTTCTASGLVWVLFQDPKTGSQCRQNSRHLFTSKHDKTWTPLLPISRQFAAGYKGQAQVHRLQFPLRPAHAKTVHRAQGDTMAEAVIDLTSRRKIDHIHYVALSRLQSLEGLHLVKLQEEKISVSRAVVDEMYRLRSMQQQPSLTFLYTMPHYFKIAFLNANSLHRHIEDVRGDYNIAATDIAAFCETRFLSTDSCLDTDMVNFFQHRQDASLRSNNYNRPSHGLAIYTKSSFLPDYPKNYSAQGIEISVIKLLAVSQDVAIIIVYKPPKISLKTLTNVLSTMMHYLQQRNVVMMGDFNTDCSSIRSNMLNNFMVKLGFTQLITAPTTDYKTTIDLIFMNMEIFNSGVMEAYYSDHKIIWAAFSR